MQLYWLTWRISDLAVGSTRALDVQVNWNEDNQAIFAESPDLQTDETVVYFPWVMEKYDGFPGVDEDDADITNRRPKPLTKARHPLFGKVLVTRALYWEREKKYWHSRHIWKCVRAQFEPGTYEGLEAEKAHRRDMSRSF